MSLPPTGADCWSVYLEKGLTTRELLSKCEMLERALNVSRGKETMAPLARCTELARTHRPIVDPPGKVSSPSDPTSLLLALLYTPMAGWSEEADREGEGPSRLGQETVKDPAPEEVIVSAICVRRPGVHLINSRKINSSLPCGWADQAPEYAVYAHRFFEEHILCTIDDGRNPESPNSFRSQKGPIYLDRDIHIAADVLIFRCCLVLADYYGLNGFRFFPAPHLMSLDGDRYSWEVRWRRAQAGLESFGRNGETVDVVQGFGEDAPPYRPLAFCAGCGKRLVGAERKKCACRIAWYCSVACQKLDWRLLHKRECERFREFLGQQEVEFQGVARGQPTRHTRDSRR